MFRQKAGVAVAGGLVDEDPAMLPIRLLEKSVVAERWNGSKWKDPFVDRALDQRALLPTAFGDHGRMISDVDPVDLVLPLPHPQRSDLERLRTRVELAPGSSGRVAHHVRRWLAHGGRRNRRPGAELRTCYGVDDTAVLDVKDWREGL